MLTRVALSMYPLYYLIHQKPAKTFLEIIISKE